MRMHERTRPRVCKLMFFVFIADFVVVCMCVLDEQVDEFRSNAYIQCNISVV